MLMMDVNPLIHQQRLWTNQERLPTASMSSWCHPPKMFNTDIDKGIKLWIVNNTYGPDLSFDMRHEQYLLKIDEDFGQQIKLWLTTMNLKKMKMIWSSVMQPLSISNTQSHLTMILDDRPMKDLTIMAMHRFDKHHEDFHSLFPSSLIDQFSCFFSSLRMIRHLFSDIGWCWIWNLQP